jgi:hypothetical protein
MTDPRRHGAARSEFRHNSKIDEGIWNLVLSPA